MKFCLFLLLNLALALSSHAQTVSWVERAEVKRAAGNLSLMARWNVAEGLHFRIHERGTDNHVDLALLPGETSIRSASGTVVHSEFYSERLPDGNMAAARAIMKFRPEIWEVYVAGRAVAFIHPPFSKVGKVYQPKNEVPAEPHDAVRFQAVDPSGFSVSDDFLPEGEDNTENPLAKWDVKAGKWRLHTVEDNAINYGKRARSKKGPPRAEFSANFYSLRSIPKTNCLITSVQSYNFYDRYSVEVAAQVVRGEMGVIFCYRDLTNYMAFTLTIDDTHDAILSLWQLDSDQGTEREILAAVRTELTHGQWVKLNVKMGLDKIECALDNVTVIDIPMELPGGGKFGLLGNAEEGVRFDDFLASSNKDLDLHTIKGIRRYLLVQEGDFLSKAMTDNTIRPIPSSKPQWLVVGSVEHTNRVFSARFSRMAGNKIVGLIAGYTPESHYRFTRQKSEDEIFQLARIDKDGTHLLEELRLPPGPGGNPDAVTLTSDGSDDRNLRLYRNGKLVLVHHLEKELRGASGLYAGRRTTTSIDGLVYKALRPDTYCNHFEKNRQYIGDPYMRHWSSPEGQWIKMTNGLTWYKGDFHGRFTLRMPLITGAELHLGVEEAETNGCIIIRTGMSKISILQPGRDPEQVDSAPNTHVDAVASGDRHFEVYYEDHWLWITSGEKSRKILLRHHLSTPLEGKRIRIRGYSTAQLKDSYVECYNLKDYLFTESLHEWVINGGRWEMVNRFKCDPRWSHMNGESKEGLAALWTKYNFKGDFCMELYAGLRHGWYRRCGDLNITVMNANSTPGKGYTITCTGWDFDHSQRLTKLYRNGEVIKESDKYLIPRNRDGNKRRGYVPLVRLGGNRDVHGAWYYIKLRRVGKKLEYYFDNELVFAVEDAEPLQDGSMGIWTFMNSMVVARVKIAADEIRPKPIKFEAIDPSTLKEDPIVKAVPESVILVDGRDPNTMSPDKWEIDDPVGRSQLTWHSTENEPYMVTRNVLGSGPMFTRCTMKPVPFTKTAGWRFLVKRTTDARFNFHYSIGRMRGKKYVAIKEGFHEVSGTSFDKSRLKKQGATKVPGLPSGPDWHKEGDWTEVVAWLPTKELERYSEDKGIMTKIDGFGNAQPSYVLQGLKGNGPGASYAIKNVSAILYEAPQFALKDGATFPGHVSVLNARSEGALRYVKNLESLQDSVSPSNRPGFKKAILQVSDEGVKTRTTLTWIDLPAQPVLSCNWSTTMPNTVVLDNDADYPDRRFAYASMAFGSMRVPLDEDRVNRLYGICPRQAYFLPSETAAIPVTVTVADKKQSFKLPWKDNSVPEGPALVKLDGGIALFQNFESRSFLGPIVSDTRRMQLRHNHDRQGTYIHVANMGKSERLKTMFKKNLNLSRYPILQFRYRATEMAHLSMSLAKKQLVELSEDYSNAQALSDTDKFIMDEKWNTWQGILTDSVKKKTFSAGMHDVGGISFGSYHKTDQTGLHSWWELDDVVIGPAVSRREQLTFTPEYFDFDGVSEVIMSVRAGRRNHDQLSDNQLAKLVWTSITNKTASCPNIDGLRDGICHLFLKATDKTGNSSPVMDIPFVVDRKPIAVKYALVESKELDGNGTLLNLDIHYGDGTSLDVSEMLIRWNNDPIRFRSLGSRFVNERGAAKASLNWPYIFRKQIEKMSDGDTSHIVIANIRDGAGNVTPDLVVPIKVDYASDKTGPTWLQGRMPRNVLWSSYKFSSGEKYNALRPDKHTTLSFAEEFGKEPYMVLSSDRSKASAQLILDSIRRKKWSIANYPYIAMRLRRPVIPERDKSKTDLVIVMQDETEFILPLDNKRKGAKVIHLAEPIKWVEGQWHPIIIDLREVLKEKIAEDRFDISTIAQVNFEHRLLSEQEVLHMQSVFIYSDWMPEHKLRLDAFDKSGTDGLVWDADGSSSTMTIAPSKVNEAALLGDWMTISARDRAGNRSYPLRIPLRGLQRDIVDKMSQEMENILTEERE